MNVVLYFFRIFRIMDRSAVFEGRSTPIVGSSRKTIFGLCSTEYMIAPWDVVNKLRVGGMDMWFTKPYSYLTIISSCFELLFSSCFVTIFSLIYFYSQII